MRVPPERQSLDRMAKMFDTVAPRYDFITRAFSYGMDPGWKRRAVREAGLADGAVVLDLACGTGDFSRLVTAARPVACDLTLGMLALAKRSGHQRVVCADAMRLPFSSGVYDAVFVGYGLRNFPELKGALDEIWRVLRPGGVLVSLDFYLPQSALFRSLYLGYLKVQGAFWGCLLHGDARVYTYIPDSLRTFVSAAGMARLLDERGFRKVRWAPFIFGGIALHWAWKPAGLPEPGETGCQ